MYNYIGGVVTKGSYFSYKGEKYGQFTRIQLTHETYVRNGIDQKTWAPHMEVFNSIEEDENGNTVWYLNTPKFEMLTPTAYYDLDPERDIEKIVTPVYYMKPRELAKERLRNGTWFLYIWQQTLIYIACLIISPIFNEWYLIWTMGLYLYLRLSYIELSRGGLDRGW